MVKVTFLGTACMRPIKERNAIATLINYQGEYILLDCGENTQRQLAIIGVSPTKITKILISHLHGDHILGLPGFLQTRAANPTTKTLEIYGPKNTERMIEILISLFVRKKGGINYKIKELGNETFFDNKDFILTSRILDHTITCLGYSFQEKDKRLININYTKKFGLTKHPLLGKLQGGKTIMFKGKKITAKEATILKKGKKITVILDTKFTEKAINLAKDSDLLIAEATFLEDLKEEAHEYKHLTAKEAAIIAKKSKSKKLILTHFSQRYKSIKDLEMEAKKIFKNTEAAKDFLEIII